MIAGDVRLAGGDLGLGLLDQGFLQALLLFDVVDGGTGGGDIGLRLIELGAVIVVDDLDQDVAAMNALEVLHQHVADVTGNLGGERRRIGLQVGVVSALQHSRPHPPVPFAHDDEDERTDQKKNKQSDAGARPPAGRSFPTFISEGASISGQPGDCSQ